MKLKTKQIVIIIISIILAIANLIVAYLYHSGIMEYETTEVPIEGMPVIPMNVQIGMLCGVAAINILNIALFKLIAKHKALLIVLNVIQLLFGTILNIIGSIVIIVFLALETTDVPVKTKEPLVLPKLEKIPAKHRWICLIVWIVVFAIIYLQVIPLTFLKNLHPAIIFALMYIVQAIILIPFLKNDIKRDFLEFKGNFKTYIRYILPRLGIFFIIYLITNLIVMLITGGTSTNQAAITNLPLAIIIIAGVFIAPFMEELMFRGMLRKGINNDIVFIVLSTITFGLVHVFYVEENWLMYLHIIPYCLIGCFLAITYKKTNNIFTNITVHFLWNAFALTMTTLLMLLQG